MKARGLYYVDRPEGHVAGPYDIVQLAGLLRRRIITAKTLVRLDDEDDWKPLAQQPHYHAILEIPADAVSMRSEASDEEAMDATWSLPLP